jgi:hypothetical protein
VSAKTEELLPSGGNYCHRTVQLLPSTGELLPSNCPVIATRFIISNNITQNVREFIFNRKQKREGSKIVLRT